MVSDVLTPCQSTCTSTLLGSGPEGSLASTTRSTGWFSVAELYNSAGEPPTSVPSLRSKSSAWLRRSPPVFRSTVASPTSTLWARWGSLPCTPLSTASSHQPGRTSAVPRICTAESPASLTCTSSA